MLKGCRFGIGHGAVGKLGRRSVRANMPQGLGTLRPIEGRLVPSVVRLAVAATCTGADYGVVHRVARIVGWRNPLAAPRRWTSGPAIRRSWGRRATGRSGGSGPVQEGRASRAALPSKQPDTGRERSGTGEAAGEGDGV